LATNEIFDHDDLVAARMIAALRSCPAKRRMDTLAVVVRVFTDEKLAEKFALAGGGSV
jgi:hypothetical protein